MEAKELHPDNEENTQKDIFPKNIESTENSEKAEHIIEQKTDKEIIPDEVLNTDFQIMDRGDIIASLNNIINNYPVMKIKDIVNKGVDAFNEKFNTDIKIAKEKYIEEHGDEEFFEYSDDSKEQLNILIKIYRDKKNSYIKTLEAQKDNNLKKKLKVIEELKELINCKESMNDTFQQFRTLQQKWHDIGMVPQQNIKELWELYHHHVENFYNYIKINKELRDIDLKKNLSQKIKFCERAEELLEGDSITEAAKELQHLHNQWREIGPVTKEEKEPIWDRFKSATEKINKKNYDFFTNLKSEQQNHLKVKLEIIEKIEKIANKYFDSHKNWNNATNALLELQKEWKQTGAAPKKDRNKIYKQFRTSCDKFFNNKREFYLKLADVQIKNLELKEKLCEKAEEIRDSKEWKATTDKFISLQKTWKKIGPVPRKHSDRIWKRFRAACDTFFDAKNKFFSHVDEEQEANMTLKKELIKKLKEFNPKGDEEETIVALKKFQNEWAEIGFVPINCKNQLQDEFREILNEQFDKLKMSEFGRDIQKYKAKIDSFLHADNTEQKILKERDKVKNKITQLESSISTWENNIGFFSESSSSNKLKEDLEHKMENAKIKLNLLKEKLHIIDKLL